jgi:hypothetical protein
VNRVVAPSMTSRDKDMSPVQDGEELKERYESSRTPGYALTRCLSVSLTLPLLGIYTDHCSSVSATRHFSCLFH